MKGKNCTKCGDLKSELHFAKGRYRCRECISVDQKLRRPSKKIAAVKGIVKTLILLGDLWDKYDKSDDIEDVVDIPLDYSLVALSLGLDPDKAWTWDGDNGDYLYEYVGEDNDPKELYTLLNTLR